MAKRALSLAISAMKDEVNFSVEFERRPFILRPERTGTLPWLDVLRDLGVSRGDPSWVDSFVPSMTAKG